MADIPISVQESDFENMQDNFHSNAERFLKNEESSSDDESELMAFIKTSLNRTESNKPITDIPNDLLTYSIQVRRETDEKEACDKEDHHTLCNVQCCLSETILNLLRQKIKLIELENADFQKSVINAVNDVQLQIKEALTIFFSESGLNKHTSFQQIQNVIESSTNELRLKEITVDPEQIVKETQALFSEYQKVYKECKSILENYFLENVEVIFKTKIEPKNNTEPHSAYVSVLKDVFSQKSFLDSSVKAYEEFEGLAKLCMEISSEDSESRTELLLAAIHKAEFSCNELKSFASVLLNIECANV